MDSEREIKNDLKIDLSLGLFYYEHTTHSLNIVLLNMALQSYYIIVEKLSLSPSLLFALLLDKSYDTAII